MQFYKKISFFFFFKIFTHTAQFTFTIFSSDSVFFFKQLSHKQWHFRFRNRLNFSNILSAKRTHSAVGVLFNFVLFFVFCCFVFAFACVGRICSNCGDFYPYFASYCSHVVAELTLLQYLLLCFQLSNILKSFLCNLFRAFGGEKKTLYYQSSN